MEQIGLAFLLDRGDQPTIALDPEQRRRLRELMRAAIIAVHRASHEDASEEGSDDDARG